MYATPTAVDRPLLRGQRIYLAALEKEDAPAFVRWSLDSGYARLLDSRMARPLSLDQAEKWIAASAEEQAYLSFGIHLLGDGRLVGFVELDGIQWNNGSAGVGIGIGDRTLWDTGLGTEAMQIVLDFAFAELGLRRITLNYFSYNRRAAHLYQRLGFVHEGNQARFITRDGDCHDLIWMGLLRREWRQISEHQRDDATAEPPQDAGISAVADSGAPAGDFDPVQNHGDLASAEAEAVGSRSQAWMPAGGGSLFAGRQIRLGALEKTDAPQLVHWSQDGQSARLACADIVRPWNLSQAESWIEARAQAGHVFAVRTPAQGLGPKRFLGWAALTQLQWDNRLGQVEIFLPDLGDWESGYAGEALFLLIRYAFHELNLRKLAQQVLESHVRLANLCREMGFVQEVSLREAVARDGKLQDLHILGLERRDWEDRLRLSLNENEESEVERQ